MTRPLQVCILTETYHPIVGGGERQAEALSEYLSRHCFEVTIVTRRTARRHAKIERRGKITIRRIPPSGRGRVAKWILLLTAPIALLRLRHRFDVLFVAGFRLVATSALPVARLLGKPCILKADSLGEFSGSYFAGGLSRLGLRPSSRLFRKIVALRNRIVKKASAFVAISAAISEEAFALDIPRAAVYSIPNSVCIERFSPVDAESRQIQRRRLGLPSEDLIVAYTGRLVSYKGLPLLVRVWASVLKSYPRSLLLLVGSGGLDIHNCEQELKRSARDLGIEDRVRFTGEVDNPQHYLQASNLFVFPTENEAFGVSLIEAMACGLPVITTQVGGLKDYVEHQGNGWVVEAGNADDLEASLKRLLGDRQLRAALGKQARKTAKARFSSDNVGPQYIRLFEQLSSSIRR